MSSRLLNGGAAWRGATGSQHGQASPEYIVVCLILVVALGVGMVTDTSPLRQLLSAFFSAFKNYSFALSLPE